MKATLLIANRGEIALRIIRTAIELGLGTVAVYAQDDADSPHVHAADEAISLSGAGPEAYLDQAVILAAAKKCGAELIHPGYGFLSENADFARACPAAGCIFVGPDAELLELFGNKSSARRAALAAGVSVLDATEGPSSIEEIRGFFAAHPSGIVIKALAGGGGRGMRMVRSPDQIDKAYRRCAAEAQLGFSDAAVFAEAHLDDARHIEAQVVAAPDGHVTRALALGDRDCSIQRRYQKLVEIAPAQCLSMEVRSELHRAAARLCSHVGYRGLATVEFLVTGDGFVFLEVNPRIQVEHTVTEEVTGVDLVAVQLAIARGASFDELGLPRGIFCEGGQVVGEPASANGIAIQSRVNMETLAADGSVLAAVGTLSVFSPASGPGVRVDSYGRAGLTPGPRYDSVQAKVITHVRSSSVPAALRKARIALAEFSVEGFRTNIGLLQESLSASELQSGFVTTRFPDDKIPELAGATLSHQHQTRVAPLELYPGEEVLRAQLAGTVVEVAPEGAELAAGEQLVVLEAMKMQHVLVAPDALRTVRTLATPGRIVGTGDPLLVFAPTGAGAGQEAAAEVDLDRPRADLDEVRRRHLLALDEGRSAVVGKRHKQGRRTARENIADLVDAGSFVEYGALAIAAQRNRRSEEDLIANTPADGLVAGVATIGADRCGPAVAEAVVVSYDYTVLAGTQGMRNHAKTDRVFELAARKRLLVVLFAEGGGGRPGDTDLGNVAGLDVPIFRRARRAERTSAVGVDRVRSLLRRQRRAGRDVRRDHRYPGRQRPHGRAGDDRGRRLGRVPPGGHRADRRAAAQRRSQPGRPRRGARGGAGQAVSVVLSRERGRLGGARPAVGATHSAGEPVRAYDVHRAIESVVDVGSVLELRPDYGVGVVTAHARVEGVPYGLLANSSHHLGGAIAAEAADKIADFLTVCESFRLPIISLCDTPGFMVGPDAEKEAAVRRLSRLFVLGARLTVPLGTIVMRKGYGLGAMAMAGGSFHATDFTVAWPTGEIGGMGLEGAVRPGFSRELAAVTDPVERQNLFDRLVEAAYQHGKALTSATTFELDDVIDPADSRACFRRILRR
jgi:acetyl/propionyl-CoA carboxylase alpha subunit/acetyl-CoA carboxylase carboxyltransferase component